MRSGRKGGIRVPGCTTREETNTIMSIGLIMTDRGA